MEIDFKKAYDNVNWNFLINSMGQMGFPSRWCKWIRRILKSARSSVLVNGAPTFEFQCGKGLRQSDPISPFLFIIVMEALSTTVDKASEVGIIHGIRTPNNGPVLTHLLYADDAIMLGEWSKDNIMKMVRILRVFHICFRLNINIAKSNLYGIEVGGLEVEEKASLVGCKVGSIPFMYLGLVVGANMNQIGNWRPVYDVFEKRLSAWKANTFSIGGRLTLIKSVLESLPNYYFSLYKAPCKVIKDLKGIIKRFCGEDQVSIKKSIAWRGIGSLLIN
ncbi:putative RNA-directed DNA polymerase [Helianthus annuus]|nr:putative RNA-directed DNA polymerase [Helianthus annuus]